MQVQPYLFFDGRCDEAIEFYRKTLGAEVKMLMRFKDSPEPHQPGTMPPGSENKVMHSTFRIGDTDVMASDGRCEGKTKFDGFALSLTLSDVAEANRLFGALSEGGNVQMPLTKTFFSPAFGMLADRFGGDVDDYGGAVRCLFYARRGLAACVVAERNRIIQHADFGYSSDSIVVRDDASGAARALAGASSARISSWFIASICHRA